VGLLNPGGPIAQFKRNRCSISPVELILAERCTQLLSGYDKLQQNGQLNVQIWELPAFDNKSGFVVIWTEA